MSDRIQRSLPYKRELDGLRGLAILLVVLYHLFPGAVSFGYVGVDVFFVLSGYLITKVIVTKREAGRFSLVEFYRSRIRRIFPAMTLVLGAVLVAGYVFLFPDELEQLGRHLFSSAFFFENFRLRDETGYWNRAAELKPLMHFWSLSIEEQFYAFWPLVVLVLFARGWYGRVASAVVLGLVLVPVSGLPNPFFHSLARFWELALGGAVVGLERNARIAGRLDRLPLLPWLVLGASLLSARGVRTFSFAVLALVVLATMLWLLRLNRNPDPFLANPGLVFLGLISFPLYLWHFPIVSFLHVFGIAPWDHRFAILAASLVLAFLTYRYVETFFRRQMRWNHSIVLVFLAMSLGLGGRFVAKSQGLPDRAHMRGAMDLARQLVRAAGTDADCEALTKKLVAGERLFTFCRSTSTDPAARFVAVIGDSHAKAAFEGFAAELSKRGIQTVLLANSGCAAFVGGAVGKDVAGMEACQRQIDQVIKVLDGLPNLSGVILAARGPRYMVDTGYGSVERRERGELHYRRTLELGPSYTNPGEYLRAIELTIRHLAGRGVPANVLLENPELGFLPSACLSRPFIGSRRCAVSYVDYAARMGDYRTGVASLVARLPGATVLDPEPVFCDRSECFAMREGELLYADDDHLSVVGSRRQAEALTGRIALKP